jgi:hypothetical protein
MCVCVCVTCCFRWHHHHHHPSTSWGLSRWHYHHPSTPPTSWVLRITQSCVSSGLAQDLSIRQVAQVLTYCVMLRSRPAAGFVHVSLDLIGRKMKLMLEGARAAAGGGGGQRRDLGCRSQIKMKGSIGGGMKTVLGRQGLVSRVDTAAGLGVHSSTASDPKSISISDSTPSTPSHLSMVSQETMVLLLQALGELCIWPGER